MTVIFYSIVKKVVPRMFLLFSYILIGILVGLMCGTGYLIAQKRSYSELKYVDLKLLKLDVSDYLLAFLIFLGCALIWPLAILFLFFVVVVKIIIERFEKWEDPKSQEDHNL